MSVYEDKNIDPMLIGIEDVAFDSENYIYELKMDGVRCIAYIDENGVDLRNKRHLALLPKFPELKNIYKNVKKKCILDGELYIYKNRKVDFFEVQKRCLTSNPFKIRIMSTENKAAYMAFDILYLEDKDVMKKTLMERKKLLHTLIKENEYINESRFIEKEGIMFFEKTKELELEGMVAKRKDSLYYTDKRTKDWIKCKNLLDEDYVVCGYIQKEKGTISLVLGQYDNNMLIDKGHVTLGVSLSYIEKNAKKTNRNPFNNDKGDSSTIWIAPHLVGTVKFMEYTANGGLRQPVFKGFREDKLPEECVINRK